MATCQEVATFLQELSGQSVSAQLPAADLAALQQFGLLQLMSKSDFAALQQEVTTMEQAQAAATQAAVEQAQAGQQVTEDTRKSHSILFHLEGVDQQHATLERLQQEQNALNSLNDEVVKRQADFSALLLKKALVDTCCAYDDSYATITTPGRVALRDLNVRLYRVGDEPFPKYWEEAKQIDGELWGIANQSALFASPLTSSLPSVDRSYLWAVSIGMAKTGGDPQAKLTNFVNGYNALNPLSDNVENTLMSAEIVSLVPHPLEESVGILHELRDEVRHQNVPEASALGVAAILLLGQRADGTFATGPLGNFLTITPSYESAAMMAIVNKPFDESDQRFHSLRALFGSWGYSMSEDTELSAAFLTVSDIPIETVAPKLAIISHGLAGYLQYPMVASAILASIPVLEANETLNLMEKAYEMLGQRTGPMNQAELICLAVRMIHGIQIAGVDEIDPTAKAVPTAPGAGVGYLRPGPFFWGPVIIAHAGYYSTFSGIGGVHPGHVHAWGGGGFGGAGGVG